MLREIVEEVIHIAVDAGERILEVYGDEASFDVEFKADESPLTRADKAANDLIVGRLGKMDIGYPIISEESKEVPYPERKSYRRFWLVDPLDGTKEFIKRNGEFTVNIALIEDGHPILGVVHVPVSSETYYGAEGLGAFQRNDGSDTILKASHYSESDTGLRVVCSRSHINEDTQAYIDRFEQPLKVSKGSSLKFLLIASGKADVYPRMGPTMEWDTGAAQCVLEQSGGEVLQADTMEPLTYNKESLLNPFFIARAALRQ
ncbi:MAG: 3'(2'),5'-bisphosphate nucleotidase CysQ [Bacteroidota bacterium]